MSLIRTILITLFFCLTQLTLGAEIFSQPPRASGGLHKSSWYSPDGLDDDMYCWDDFTLSSSQPITEIHWRGGYANYPSGTGHGIISKFTIAVYGSIGGGSQPDLGTGALYKFTVNSNAGETPAGTFGGYAMFDYAATFPKPFQATGGVKYWIQIEAAQGLSSFGWQPDWSIAAGTGGDNIHFRRITGAGYNFITDDLAFSLFGAAGATVTINASELPAGTGIITGAGVYPLNSTASLTATPIAGYGFMNWTENGNQVSTNANYNFTATANRTLVANFVPAYTITTAAYPPYAGTTSGDGTYNENATVTLAAAPNFGFVFSSWNDGSPDNPHSFPAQWDAIITAFFDPAPNCTTFDFDNGPVHVSLPLTYTQAGLSATLSGGFSIQPWGSVGLAPAGMSGNYIFPNSVFASDLDVSFSRTLTDFSILYSPQELGCDNSATMRATALRAGVQVGTATTTIATPGTWPTGTLAISVPAGFDSVVVHYDHRPTTCQDWGPIFIADIMTVRMLPCPGDLNTDGLVDDSDFVIFAQAYDLLLCSDPLMPLGCPADLNADTLVDDSDFVLFANAYNALLCP